MRLKNDMKRGKEKCVEDFYGNDFRKRLGRPKYEMKINT